MCGFASIILFARRLVEAGRLLKVIGVAALIAWAASYSR
jgi:hypothetical protein